MLSRNEDLQTKLLAARKWDLVICDEAHRMSATCFGGEVKYTKRYSLAERVDATLPELSLQGRPGAGDLWGKFRDESRGGPAWHPLIDHCTDVACVLEALLKQPTIRRRLAWAGGLDDLDEVQAARLCFLAFIHDLGKCNWAFQRKILPEVTERAGHVFEVGVLLLDERLSRAFEVVLPVADMADWMEDEGLLPLFVAVTSHHSRQLRVTDGNMAIPCDSSFRRLWEPAHGRRPLNDVRSVIAAARSTFANWGCADTLDRGLPTRLLRSPDAR